MNILIKENSQYLKRHADDPINWYPWGEAAFEAAEIRDVPIFMSIGYSTCYWCGRMHTNTFQDQQLADYLNENYVAILVDRDESPAVDSLYMSACHAMIGTGGWPMNLVLAHNRMPFWASGYLTVEGQGDTPGLLDFLRAITEMWNSDRSVLINDSSELLSYIDKKVVPAADIAIPEIVDSAMQRLSADYDRQWGGFGKKQKFVEPHKLLFLLRHWSVSHDDDALVMVARTLVSAYRGGIYDHIDSGFFRYATDQYWYMPHFEKLLSDNATNVLAYTEGYAALKNELFRQVACGTLDYMFRQLHDECGGFYCGQDANTNYYLLSRQELIRILGKTEGTRFSEWFCFFGNNNGDVRFGVPALMLNDEYDRLPADIKAMIPTVSAYRRSRYALDSDPKIITAWNALTIHAFARAAEVFDRTDYYEIACETAEYIEKNLKREDGRLYLSRCGGAASRSGQLSDYAYYASALLALYRVDFDCKWLVKAIDTAAIMVDLMFDDKDGGFFAYAKDEEGLPVRLKPVVDEGQPSGNAVALSVLHTLSVITRDGKWKQLADKQALYLASAVQSAPTGSTAGLMALEELERNSAYIICCASENADLSPFKAFLREYDVAKPLAFVLTEANRSTISEISEVGADYPIPEEGCVYYMCNAHQCASPKQDLDELGQELSKM